MPSLRVIDTGLVYRNPFPNIRGRHAYFPSLAELEGGELAVTMDIGSALEATDVRSYLARSQDGGQTWSAPALVYAPDESSEPVSTSVRMTRGPDGALIGLLTLFDRSRKEEGLGNPKSDGFVRTRFAIIRSKDRGATWSSPEFVTPPLEWESFESCSPLVFVDPKRALLPTALWRDWEGNCPLGMKAVAFLSDDGGRSWSRWAEVMNGWERGIAYWEQKQIRLTDGRLLAVGWTYDVNRKESLRNRYAFSEDRGESYGPPLESPLHGETCTPLALPDNRILCVYRRADKKGLWAHLAKVEGQKWIPLADAPLWGTEVGSYGKKSDSAFDQLATLRFGYPSVIRLGSGEILAAFWGVEDCVSNIRWVRIEARA